MTYKEIKDRLTKCELTLEKIKNGQYTGKDVKEKTVKLELLKESYQKLLKEAQEKTYLVTPKSGKTKALSLGDDEVDALEDADDIDAIKSAEGEDIKEMKPGDEESQEHERFKRLSPKDQETINKIRAMMQAEKDKQLAQDQMDHDQETYDREIGENEEEGDYIAGYDDGEGPAAEAGEGDERDHMGENEAEDTEGGDLDVGHQDDEPDMLKQYAYDIATYAAKLYKQLDKYDKMDGEVDFPNWWQSKVILSRDYISKAQHYLEFEEKQPALDQLALEEGKIANMIGAGILTLATVAGLGKVATPSKDALKDSTKLVQVNDTMKLALNDMSYQAMMKLVNQMKDAGINLPQTQPSSRKLSGDEFETVQVGHYAKQIEKYMSSSKHADKFVIGTQGTVNYVANPNQITPLNEGQAQIKKKLDKINQALQQHKDKTIAISKIPADQRSEEDKAHLAKMVDLTKMKKQLTAQYDDAVSGMGAGQELDANISERVGGIEEFISLIQDRAADSDFSEQDEAVEVIEAIAEHYEIDIEFGRLGGGDDNHAIAETNEEKGSK